MGVNVRVGFGTTSLLLFTPQFFVRKILYINSKIGMFRRFIPEIIFCKINRADNT